MLLEQLISLQSKYICTYTPVLLRPFLEIQFPVGVGPDWTFSIGVETHLIWLECAPLHSACAKKLSQECKMRIGYFYVMK